MVKQYNEVEAWSYPDEGAAEVELISDGVASGVVPWCRRCGSLLSSRTSGSDEVLLVMALSL